VQKVFDVLSKRVEVCLHLLETTWVGSVVEAIIGKAVVGAALVGVLRFLESARLRFQAKPVETSKGIDLPAHPRMRTVEFVPSSGEDRVLISEDN
jgi:hypothetical protein